MSSGDSNRKDSIWPREAGTLPNIDAVCMRTARYLGFVKQICWGFVGREMSR